MAFKWNRDQIVYLIVCVQKHSCLYDTKSEEHLDRNKKAQAFNLILKEMQEMDSTITLQDIKRKWRNLRTQYMKEIRAIKLSRKIGSGRADLYIPKLWCFGHLHFLTNSNMTESKVSSEQDIFKIDGKKLEQKCRICLEENAELNWNDFLYDRNCLTYKDCYYKYTHLDYLDGDNFPTMLCRTCSNGLESIETFISKAIETHNLLLRKIPVDNADKDQKETIKEEKTFEIILLEETNTKRSVQETPTTEEFIEVLKETEEKENTNLSKMSDTAITQTMTQRILKPSKRKEEKIEESSEPMLNNETLFEKKKKRRQQLMCCSICSKVLCSKYKAILHEKIHLKNRERNETCSECGMKFFSKVILKSHMQTHLESREKSQKCEFCDKAFYNKGALNVHRRIHLGQIVKCSLCAKEYYRQIDLDKHMISHSAVRINGDIKLRKKIFVCCKICGENVRTINYKSHNAKHMNEPLCKCSICNKEFFSRNSCNSHLKKFHKKTNGGRSDFIISYRKNRCSNLFLQQNAIKLFVEE